MHIRKAQAQDLPALSRLDRHVTEKELQWLISRGRVLVAEENRRVIGWLRYNLFWDNTPFMNMLYLLEPCRGMGHGKQLVLHWEAEMRGEGYPCVMTSTASDEYAQHFYRRLGYRTVGGFTFRQDPFELLMMKEL